MSGFHPVTAPHCTVCDKSVFKMEEVVAIGRTWHKDCFLCGGNGTAGGCKKHLTLDAYSDHEGQPYCRSCHGRLFGPRGFGHANVHSYVDDAGVAAATETAAAASAVDVVAPHTVAAAVAHHPDTAHATGAAAKFGAASPHCTVCDKSVFKMEEVVAIGRTWHKDCFLCGGNGTAGGCKKHLTLDAYSDHEGQPYCRSCHGRLFGPRGFGHANVHSYVDDAGVAAVTESVASASVADVVAPHTVAAAVAHHPDTAHATGVAAKFGAASPHCTVCDKSVFKMEEVVAIGRTWHKDCFLCGGNGTAGGCKKHLTLDAYSDHEGQPYCRSCHGRLFGPRGFGHANVHSYVDDTGVSPVAPS